MYDSASIDYGKLPLFLPILKYSNKTVEECYNYIRHRPRLKEEKAGEIVLEKLSYTWKCVDIWRIMKTWHVVMV